MKKSKSSEPEIIIITGLSGAGKSIAIKSIEDFGGFCVDNMPSALIMQFVKLIKTSAYLKSLIALGIDIRGRELMRTVFDALSRTKEMGFSYRVIFLEARETTIMRRYKESRHRHPLISKGESLKKAMEKERKSLAPLREKADIIIDTSNLSPHKLKQKLKDILFEKGEKSININIMSFGFKYGIPEDIDMIIDTRFLPNPHYHDHLFKKNGNDKEIVEFVMRSSVSKEFVSHYKDLLDFIIPNYIKEGKSYYNIGVGCTGGKHRSVVILNKISQYLSKKKYNVIESHRDIKN